jgi:hypothetical protein
MGLKRSALAGILRRPWSYRERGDFELAAFADAAGTRRSESGSLKNTENDSGRS